MVLKQVFGHLGDTLGRKRIMLFCLIVTGVATFLVAFLPTYQQVGILAPILLLLLRLVQGFVLGGESSGAGTMILEHAPFGRRALVTVRGAGYRLAKDGG